MDTPAKPDHVLTHENIEWMTRPLVYIRRRVCDGRALYVGASSYGLVRPLDSEHEKARLEDGEVLEVYVTQTPEQAFELEAIVIKREKPSLNGPSERKVQQECQCCGKSFESRHKTAKYCSNSCRFKAWDRRYPRQRAIINA